MGRKSGKKEERRKLRSNSQVESTFSRRQFGILVGGIVLTLSGIVGARKWKNNDAQWSFLDSVSVPYYDSLDLIQEHCVRVGEVFEMQKGSEVLLEAQRDVSDLLLKEIKDLSWNGNYTIFPEVQYFCVPDSMARVQSYTEYCKKATVYLASHAELSDLLQTQVLWTPISQGQDFSHGWNGRGFIALDFYAVQHFTVQNNNDPSKKFNFSRGRREKSSYAYLRYKKWELDKWYIITGSHNPYSALRGPYSELLPLSVWKATVEYEKTAGSQNSEVAVETVTEALSYLLTGELLRELAVPNGKEYLEQSLTGMLSPAYVHVPAAIRWMKKNSMRAGLEVYLNSPAEFMKRINL